MFGIEFSLSLADGRFHSFVDNALVGVDVRHRGTRSSTSGFESLFEIGNFLLELCYTRVRLGLFGLQVSDLSVEGSLVSGQIPVDAINLGNVFVVSL